MSDGSKVDLRPRLIQIVDRLFQIQRDLENELRMAERRDDRGVQGLRQAIGQVKVAQTWVKKADAENVGGSE